MDQLSRGFKKKNGGRYLIDSKVFEKKSNVKLLNNAGYSVKSLIYERGTEQMKAVMEELFHE